MKNKFILLLCASSILFNSCKKDSDDDSNPTPSSTDNSGSGSGGGTTTPVVDTRTVEFSIDNKVVNADTVAHDLGSTGVGTNKTVSLKVTAVDGDYFIDFGKENPLAYPNWTYSTTNEFNCGAFSEFAFNIDTDTITVKKGETATIEIRFSPDDFSYYEYTGTIEECFPNIGCFPFPNCEYLHSTGIGNYNSTISFSYLTNNVTSKVTLDVSGTGTN